MKKIKMKWIFALGLLYISLLSGCAMREPIGSKAFVVESPADRQAALAKLTFWRMSGSFSIQQVNQRPEIASYVWWQSNQTYRLSVSSALNLYHLDITKQNGTVTLWKNGTFLLKARSAEGLLQKAMGWSLPVSALQYWAKGMVAPRKMGRFKARYDAYGHLVGLKQDGWTLKFSAYKRKVGSPDYPQVITLCHFGVKVKLVVKERLLLMKKYMMRSASV